MFAIRHTTALPILTLCCWFARLSVRVMARGDPARAVIEANIGLYHDYLTRSA